MDVFALRKYLIEEYRRYVESFVLTRDPRIEGMVRQEMDRGVYWPAPLIQLNPKSKHRQSVRRDQLNP